MSLSESFSIDSQVRKTFPEIKIGVALIRDVKVAAQNPDLENLKKKVAEEVRERLRGQAIPQLPRIKAFRTIYKKFGVEPNSRRPSAEALLRRIIDPGKGLYTVNTVVDAYNITSLQYQLPMAAYDFDNISLPLVLRFAQAGEPFCAIGQSQPEALSAGELVYADQATILCRDFNYRDADLTKVTLESKNLIIFVDGCGEVSREELATALEIACKRITAFNSGETVEYLVFPNEK